MWAGKAPARVSPSVCRERGAIITVESHRSSEALAAKERVMRRGSIAVLVILVALLAAAGWYAYEGLATGGAPMPTEAYVALIAGAGFAIVIGAGLMALLFYSSRRGYDEPPHYTKDP
jgi:hypothetical protein